MRQSGTSPWTDLIKLIKRLIRAGLTIMNDGEKLGLYIWTFASRFCRFSHSAGTTDSTASQGSSKPSSVIMTHLDEGAGADLA